MKADLSLSDIEAIKAELGRLLPEVKSSHRVEAMARGLGWNTNAALRAALAGGPALRHVDNLAFHGYLKEHGFPGQRYDALAEAVVRCKFAAERAAIEAVMAKEPELTHFGFGVYEEHKLTREERELQFKKNRGSMLTAESVAEYMRACEYLSQVGRRATINKNTSDSYGLKHRAEKFHRDRKAPNCYIANGMFIDAAVHLGFKISRSGPNAYLNISSAKPKKAGNPSSGLRLASHVGGKTRLTAWRNMMVAAINAGLDQGIFGLESDANHWNGNSRTYRFSFEGLPAIANVRDAGFGELSIHVAVNPTNRAEEFIIGANAGHYAGDAFASGWLERKDGKWLQTDKRPCNAFRRHILPVIAAAAVEPQGYSDTGRVMM